MKRKKIEKELFYLICLCGKSERKKKKIMMPNDNFTLILLYKGISTINIESGKKLVET